MLGEMTVADPEAPPEGASAAQAAKQTKDTSSEILSLKTRLGSLREMIKKELRASSDVRMTDLLHQFTIISNFLLSLLIEN